MKLIIIILLFTGLYFSCNSGESLKKYISGNSSKYWLVLNDPVEDKVQTFYYFNIDKVWLVFRKLPNGEFNKYHGGDIRLIENWEIMEDDVISIGGYEYAIIELNECNFILSDSSNEITTLIKAPLHLIPENYLNEENPN